MGPLAFFLRTKASPSLWVTIPRAVSWQTGLSRSHDTEQETFRDRVTTAVYEGIWDHSSHFISEG